MPRIVRAATAHIAPYILSAQSTTQKVINHIQVASRQNVNLVAFPESFIPAFPVWSTFLAPAKAHHLFQRMAEEAIFADGEEIRAIRDAAARSNTLVNLGFTERVRYSSATLFNSNLIIGDDGKILVHHRKLVPTWMEKLTWAAGDGYGLRIADTNYGKIGALICGENTNPLARFSLMAQGEQIHISTWPAAWPSRIDAFEASAGNDIRGSSAKASADIGETAISQPRPRNYDNIAANRTRAAAHCFEAKCFGIVCAPYMSPSNIDNISTMTEEPSRTRAILEQSPKAVSMFLDPTGALMSGFTVDPQTGKQEARDHLQDEEGILYADLDLDACVEGKQYHDVVGGYQRFDVFDLKVNRRRQVPVKFDDGDGVD